MFSCPVDRHFPHLQLAFHSGNNLNAQIAESWQIVLAALRWAAVAFGDVGKGRCQYFGGHVFVGLEIELSVAMLHHLDKILEFFRCLGW